MNTLAVKTSHVEGTADFCETVLVAGGAGFIGANFVREQLCIGARRVVVIDKLGYAGHLCSLPEDQADGQLRIVHGDLRNSDLLTRLFEEYQPTSVYNFAADSHVDRSIDTPGAVIENNVSATNTLLNQALRYWERMRSIRREKFRCIQVSTDEVYGALGTEGRFCEHQPYRPTSPYAASKAATDHIALAYQRTYGLPVLVSNCSNNFGPYQFPEKLIPLAILNAIHGKPIPIYGNGENIREWLHVADHCRALQRLQEHGVPGETYLIGGGDEKSNLDVVHAVCQAVELHKQLPQGSCKSLITFVEDRPGHDYRYAVDSTKLRQATGWEPAVTFEEGIRKTVAWYLRNLTWVERVGGDGRRKRLGLRRGSQEQGRHVEPYTPPATEHGDAPIDGVVIKPLSMHTDQRGWLIELFRSDQILEENLPQMAYVSESEPGVVRGPHEHREQADYFAFIGPGEFELVLWDGRSDSNTCGYRVIHRVGASNPTAVIIPPGVVHAYRNIGPTKGWVFNAPNQLYAGVGKSKPVDEIRHELNENSPYQLPALSLEPAT